MATTAKPSRENQVGRASHLLLPGVDTAPHHHDGRTLDVRRASVEHDHLRALTLFARERDRNPLHGWIEVVAGEKIGLALRYVAGKFVGVVGAWEAAQRRIRGP